jgi:hypothetical protein
MTLNACSCLRIFLFSSVSTAAALALACGSNRESQPKDAPPQRAATLAGCVESANSSGAIALRVADPTDGQPNLQDRSSVPARGTWHGSRTYRVESTQQEQLQTLKGRRISATGTIPDRPQWSPDTDQLQAARGTIDPVFRVTEFEPIEGECPQAAEAGR